MKKNIILGELTEILDSKLQIGLAESWDNVGLLVGDKKKEVNNILLSLELSYDVLLMAEKNQVDLIITHHPAIFSGLKKIVDDNSRNLIFQLIQKNIALYSAHTNFDSIEGGLNDYVVNLLDGENISIVKNENEEHGICRIFDTPTIKIVDYIEKVKNSLEISDLRFVGNIKQEISKVAVVTGSGSEYIELAVENGAQLIITGDMKYHYALELKEKGYNVIDAGHFETEKVFPEAIYKFIQNNIPEIKDLNLIKSNVDVNPFEYR